MRARTPVFVCVCLRDLVKCNFGQFDAKDLQCGMSHSVMMMMRLREERVVQPTCTNARTYDDVDVDVNILDGTRKTHHSLKIWYCCGYVAMMVVVVVLLLFTQSRQFDVCVCVSVAQVPDSSNCSIVVFHH